MMYCVKQHGWQANATEIASESVCPDTKLLKLNPAGRIDIDSEPAHIAHPA
jgi:hypothetical protein